MHDKLLGGLIKAVGSIPPVDVVLSQTGQCSDIAVFMSIRTMSNDTRSLKTVFSGEGIRYKDIFNANSPFNTPMYAAQYGYRYNTL